jgi:hypothetical protein
VVVLRVVHNQIFDDLLKGFLLPVLRENQTNFSNQSDGGDMADYDIASVLQSCQINAAHHKRGCRELLRILEASDSFTPRFLGHLYRILIVSQNAPAVERLVGFVTNFVVFLGESPQEHVSANGSECAAAVLSYLMGCCDKESKYIRERSVKIISNVLSLTSDPNLVFFACVSRFVSPGCATRSSIITISIGMM